MPWPPWLGADAQLTALAEVWAEALLSVASRLHKATREVDKMGRPMRFAALPERLHSLNGICATLVSWCNHAAGIGLLPPACAIEPPDPTRLPLSDRRYAKRFIEKYKPKPKATGPSSESGAGDSTRSHDTIAKRILNKMQGKVQEKTGVKEKKQQDLLFPPVAEELKAQAQRLRLETKGLPRWVENPYVHELVAVSFIMLENEIISTNRISVPAKGNRTFGQLCERRVAQEVEFSIEQLIARYREVVPGGGAATDEELVELGIDGIVAVMKKHRMAILALILFSLLE